MCEVKEEENAFLFASGYHAAGNILRDDTLAELSNLLKALEDVESSSALPPPGKIRVRIRGLSSTEHSYVNESERSINNIPNTKVTTLPAPERVRCVLNHILVAQGTLRLRQA